MAVKKREEKVGEALLKVALGCRVEEVTEEYAEVDGELKLTKRRETKKDIPPDLKAVQMLLAAKEDGADYAAMSDEQLNAERERLLAALRETESGADRKGGAALREEEGRADRKGAAVEAGAARKGTAVEVGITERKGTAVERGAARKGAVVEVGAARKDDKGNEEEALKDEAVSENAAPKARKKRAAPRKKRRAIKRRNI